MSLYFCRYHNQASNEPCCIRASRVESGARTRGELAYTATSYWLGEFPAGEFPTGTSAEHIGNYQEEARGFSIPPAEPIATYHEEKPTKKQRDREASRRSAYRKGRALFNKRNRRRRI